MPKQLKKALLRREETCKNVFSHNLPDLSAFSIIPLHCDDPSLFVFIHSLHHKLTITCLHACCQI